MDKKVVSSFRNDPKTAKDFKDLCNRYSLNEGQVLRALQKSLMDYERNAKEITLPFSVIPTNALNELKKLMDKGKK